MTESEREQAIIAEFRSLSEASGHDIDGSVARVLLRLSSDDTAVLTALADIVTITALQQQELRARSLEVEQLQHALDSRVRLEQAKGVLLASGAASLEEAFRAMRDYARSNSLGLHDVAESVVRGRLRPTPAGNLAVVAMADSVR